MKERIANRSKLEGFEESRLPAFTQEEIQNIKGTYDFLGLNHYSSYMVKTDPEPEIGSPSWDDDTGIYEYQLDEWTPSASEWIRVRHEVCLLSHAIVLHDGMGLSFYYFR